MQGIHGSCEAINCAMNLQRGNLEELESFCFGQAIPFSDKILGAGIVDKTGRLLPPLTGKAIVGGLMR
jgi:hypothetical protein